MPIKHKSTLFLLLLIILCSACTPEIVDVDSLCPPSLNSPVRISVDSLAVPAQPAGGMEGIQHQVYIRDLLRAMEPAEGVSLEGDMLQMAQFFRSKLAEGFAYEGPEADISSTANPLDFIESLISNLDSDQVIEEFQIQKQTAADAAERDEQCLSVNSNVIVNLQQNDDEFEQLPYLIAYDYNPGVVNPSGEAIALNSQLIIHNLFQDNLLSATRSGITYTSIAYWEPADFPVEGYEKPIVLDISYNTDDGFNQLNIQDDPFFRPEFNLMEVSFTMLPKECAEDYESGECPDSAILREPAFTQCVEQDEGRFEERTFSIGSMSGLKRAKIEVDFDAEEARLYVSDYIRATNDPFNEGELIKDPTLCEEEIIFDEINRNAESPTPLPLILDPGYDFNADNAPTPFASYSSLPVPSRQ